MNEENPDIDFEVADFITRLQNIINQETPATTIISDECLLYMQISDIPSNPNLQNYRLSATFKSDTITKSVFKKKYHFWYRHRDSIREFSWAIPKFYGEDAIKIAIWKDHSLTSELHRCEIVLRDIWKEQQQQDEINFKDGKYGPGSYFVKRKLPFNAGTFQGVDLYCEFRIIPLRYSIGDSHFSHVNSIYSCERFGSVRLLRAVSCNLCRMGYFTQTLGLRDEDNRNLLDRALFSGHESQVRYLLTSAGKECFQRTEGGQSAAIHHAVLGGNSQCFVMLIRFMIFNGAVTIGNDIHARLQDFLEWRNPLDYTPIMCACTLPIGDAQKRIVRVLFRLGVDCGIQSNVNGKTCLILALENSNFEMANIILSKKKTRTELRRVYLDNIHNPKRWHSLRCNPCLRSNNGLTAMLICAINGNIDFIDTLHRLEVPYQESDNQGNNILHIAIQNNRKKVIEKVIFWELNHWKTMRKNLPFIEAKRTFEMNNLFTSRNFTGSTPLMLAESLMNATNDNNNNCENNEMKNVFTLLKNGFEDIQTIFIASDMTNETNNTTNNSINVINNNLEYSLIVTNENNIENENGNDFGMDSIEMTTIDMTFENNTNNTNTTNNTNNTNNECELLHTKTKRNSKRNSFTLKEPEFIDDESDAVEYILALAPAAQQR